MNKQAKIKLYAEALAEIIIEKKAEGPERSRRIVANFVKLLVGAGYENKAKEILELVEDMLLQKQGKRKITFETARKSTPSQNKLLEKFVKKGDILKEKINPELIAGVKIVINEERQFDNSMQSKLNNIL
ncbi:MAG: F0F1 ATP synthase subunit delta [Candidatus Staskawiczbacteria bacterium]|nr:F0F1 ATP synthase subunit delta [Candidatus Staskawiczbacteria bacterium]